MIDADGPGAIADVARVRGLLIDSARDAQAMTYSELLLALGHRFTRPKMRALCRTLDAIDAAGDVRGEPGLAVLVVRQSDGLPGQGWWIDTGVRDAYAGAWTGSEAAAFVREQQAVAFQYWRDHEGDDRTADPPPGPMAPARYA